MTLIGSLPDYRLTPHFDHTPGPRITPLAHLISPATHIALPRLPCPHYLAFGSGYTFTRFTAQYTCAPRCRLRHIPTLHCLTLALYTWIYYCLPHTFPPQLFIQLPMQTLPWTMLPFSVTPHPLPMPTLDCSSSGWLYTVTPVFCGL